MHSNRVGNIGGYCMLFPLFNDWESSVKGHSRGGGCNSNNTKLASTTLYSQVPELSETEPPLLLPQLSNIFVTPQGQVHLLVVNQILRLVAWKVSARDCPRNEFQQGLQSLSQVPEDQTHRLIMNRLGVNKLMWKLIHIHGI